MKCEGQFAYFQVESSVLIPITIIYVLMFFTGVIGNFAVCFVIIKNRSLHNATNYYLFSLAISYLIILLLGKFSLPLNDVCMR